MFWASSGRAVSQPAAPRTGEAGRARAREGHLGGGPGCRLAFCRQCEKNHQGRRGPAARSVPAAPESDSGLPGLVPSPVTLVLVSWGPFAEMHG